jgi:hypothetical protein
MIISGLKSRIDKLQGEISPAKQEAEEAKQGNERLKGCGFWTRVFNR